jgi:hypothetical protein
VSHDALDRGMFWAGALMALAPVIFISILVGIWWWRRRQETRRRGPAA